MNRPCLGLPDRPCGVLIPTGSRCAPCRREWDRTRRPDFDTRYGKGWREKSARQRKRVPFCERCGTTERLQADHIIPGSLAGGLRTLCIRCHAAIGARRDREGEALR